jgi:hypothetical protein
MIAPTMPLCWRPVRLRQDPHCALCGPAATIMDLSKHRDATVPACAV